MEKYVVYAYSLGGTCLAILIGGAVDKEFTDVHLFVVQALAAGVPAAIGTAYALEMRIPEGRILIPVIMGFGGMAIAFFGVVVYFWVAHPSIRDGFLFGCTWLVACYWRSFNEKHLEVEREIVEEQTARTRDEACAPKSRSSASINSHTALSIS